MYDLCIISICGYMIGWMDKSMDLCMDREMAGLVNGWIDL